MLASSALPWELPRGWDRLNSKYFGTIFFLLFYAAVRVSVRVSTDFKVKLCPECLELGLSQPRGNSHGIAEEASMI